MNVRVVGMTVACALAVLASPLRAEPLEHLPGIALPMSASAGEVAFAEFGGAGSGTMLRRQPAPVTPRATPKLRRLRKGTISLGAQAGYGIVRGSSELNDHFDAGLGYAFRFRYMLSTRSALGFSFESQRYGTRAGLPVNPEPFATDSELVVTTVASEIVLLFNRERETNPYLVGGLGYASPNVTYDRKESRRVDEGPFLVVGVGLERFVRQRMSLDFSLRGYAQVGNSELSMFSQLTGGIHLYPGD